ncbi:hypothetical protein BDY24DRAFT_18874 [Mrakia frigida]|uniref:uncharacterized protein n=1 Tax=Mrakia frigida TaxID=29902 RepID=UPI003FCC1DED
MCVYVEGRYLDGKRRRSRSRSSSTKVSDVFFSGFLAPFFWLSFCVLFFAYLGMSVYAGISDQTFLERATRLSSRRCALLLFPLFPSRSFPPAPPFARLSTTSKDERDVHFVYVARSYQKRRERRKEGKTRGERNRKEPKMGMDCKEVCVGWTSRGYVQSRRCS